MRGSLPEGLGPSLPTGSTIYPRGVCRKSGGHAAPDVVESVVTSATRPPLTGSAPRSSTTCRGTCRRAFRNARVPELGRERRDGDLRRGVTGGSDPVGVPGHRGHRQPPSATGTGPRGGRSGRAASVPGAWAAGRGGVIGPMSCPRAAGRGPLCRLVSAYARVRVRVEFTASASAVFGLGGEAEAEPGQAFRSPGDDPRQPTGLLGGFMVLLSAGAVSRAGRRPCERARTTPRSGTCIAARP